MCNIFVKNTCEWKIQRSFVNKTMIKSSNIQQLSPWQRDQTWFDYYSNQMLIISANMDDGRHNCLNLNVSKPLHVSSISMGPLCLFVCLSDGSLAQRRLFTLCAATTRTANPVTVWQAKRKPYIYEAWNDGCRFRPFADVIATLRPTVAWSLIEEFFAHSYELVHPDGSRRQSHRHSIRRYDVAYWQWLKWCRRWIPV